MSETKVIGETSVVITPEIIAKAFWCMNSEDQAKFFECLANEVHRDFQDNNYYAEIQWLRMTEDVKKLGKSAENMFLSFTSFAYDYWPQKYQL